MRSSVNKIERWKFEEAVESTGSIPEIRAFFKNFCTIYGAAAWLFAKLYTMIFDKHEIARYSFVKVILSRIRGIGMLWDREGETPMGKHPSARWHARRNTLFDTIYERGFLVCAS